MNTCHHCCADAHERRHSHTHEHGAGSSGLAAWAAPAASFLLLAGGLALDACGAALLSSPAARFLWYLAAFLPVGWPAAREAWAEIRRGDVFNEFTLMLIAAIGTFYIGEYPEAVAVMLFYSAGERFQDRAVTRARRDIEALARLRPDRVTVVRGDRREAVSPESVLPGATIEVPAGGRLPLDGTLLSEAADFDAAALTGESTPRSVETGGSVAAGMIALSHTVRVRVDKPYGESALARILSLVRDAAARKAPAERFIRRFARAYTPAVIGAAAVLVAAPAAYARMEPSFSYDFDQWLYRALTFLVVSCPCALVVSVPLGYFSGIGTASRRGILFKGGSYLDVAARVSAVVFDKTGTLTKGAFEVTGIAAAAGTSREELLAAAASAESASTHPVARAVARAAKAEGAATTAPERAEEVAGQGVAARVGGREVLAGNLRLLQERGVACGEAGEQPGMTQVFCAIDGRYAGALALEDAPKDDAARAVAELRRLGITDVSILSGDKESIVRRLAARLGVAKCCGDLLPEDKVARMKELLAGGERTVAFVGDGINDAPVLALSHLGVAMGGAGSDAAVETADVVVQGDSPAKVAEAIRIGRATRRVVQLNIGLAIAAKLLVLTLGALGLTGLWEAVVADTGVALLCVANVFWIGRLAGKTTEKS